MQCFAHVMGSFFCWPSPTWKKAGNMREIQFSKQTGAIRNAYRNGDELLLLYACSLPDVCVACGKPAYGNVEHKGFLQFGFWWYILPPVLDFLALLLNRRFLFEFPFCSKCPPGAIRFIRARVDEEMAVFRNVPREVLDLLPEAPLDVMAERNRSWIERNMRS